MSTDHRSGLHSGGGGVGVVPYPLEKTWVPGMP